MKMITKGDRFMNIGEILIIVIDFLLIVNSFSHKCVHDEISSLHFSFNYISEKDLRRNQKKRSISYEPLSIHIFISDTDQRLPRDVIFNINIALQRSTEFLHEAIKVRQTAKPFLLERTTCSQRWRWGPNKGKCSRRKSVPEFCKTKDTDFIIPDQYLNKLEIYDNISSTPLYSVKSGAGAKDSNLIIFIISKTTSWCQNNDVQAYGSYCRLDPINRPIAGLLNLCPEKFSKKLYKPDHYFNIIMHEIFHILGFSKDLLLKFRTCSSIHNCEIPKNIVNKDKNGISRLLFPEVVQSMQKHFNCSNKDFGAPLENSNMEFSSHWHSLLMHSSIMTPSIQQDDYIVIDNITLALLASSGWYEIDFTKAQSFEFGRGEGCNFGFENCTKSKFLCEANNVTGCDISYKTIGKCEKIASHHHCGVFKPNKEESCVEEEGKLYDSDLKSKDFEKRCIFLQKDYNSEFIPACAVLNCKSSTLHLYINGTWIECVNNNLTETANFSLCPIDHLTFCPSKLNLNVENENCSFEDNNFALSIQMFFDNLPVDSTNSNNIEKLKSQIVEAVVNQLEIPKSYIIDSSLDVSKSVTLKIFICPPTYVDKTELQSLIHKMQMFLSNSTFATIFKGTKDVAIASSEISIDSEQAIAFSDYEGFRALIIVPFICGIFVLASFLASVIRLVKNQRRVPKAKTVHGMELK